MLSDQLDRVIAYAACDEQSTIAAREEWSREAGRVFEDDSLYEERATAFLEWFALERIGNDGRTPIERLLEETPPEKLEWRWSAALFASHRSLFEVQALGPGSIQLRDLLGGAIFSVVERRRLLGVAVREILEARLVANIESPPELLFTRAVQFHPREAATQLRRLASQARRRGELRATTLFRLARLRLKALRYRHVGADKIYASDDAGPVSAT